MPAWRTISLWMDQLEEPLLPRPALEHDLDVDVAIIGGGFTGVATAVELAERGLDDFYRGELAQRLGISERSLYRKLKALGIHPGRG